MKKQTREEEARLIIQPESKHQTISEAKRTEHFKVDVKTLNRYVKAGFCLAGCVGFTKKPAVKGFLNTPYNPGLTIKNNNYQVLLKRRYLVIDVDPRHFSPDDKPLSRLASDCHLELSSLKDTFIVQTPRKGFHFYYKIPEGLTLKTSDIDFPGLEFKTSFIMAAGSYNEERDINYTIINRGPDDIAPAPDLLLGFLAREERILAAKEGLLTDHPANISRYAQFLNTTPPAVSGQNGDVTTFKTAAVGKDLGLSVEKTTELMFKHYNLRCDPPWEPSDLEEKIKNAYEYGQTPAGAKSIEREFDKIKEPPPRIIWNKTKNGAIKVTLGNTINWLNAFSDSILRDKLRLNLMSNKIEFTSAPPWARSKVSSLWTDNDAIEAKSYLSTVKFYEVSVGTIHEAAHIIAAQNSYHPVRQYLQSLVWDGYHRLDTWLSDYCGAKNNRYTRAVSAKVLIGAVTRVMRPPCKFDYCLVLEGDQGIGKSQVCKILGGPWFTDTPVDPSNLKACVELMQGKWIVELCEMDVLRRSEMRTLRSFISREEDSIRPAYGRVTQAFPRQCIFIGTINPESEGYLSDPTGNRRFWPVAVTRIDLTRLKRDRDQLMAEALTRYYKRETLYIENDQLLKVFEAEVAARQQEDPWTAIIEDWFSKRSLEFYDSERKSCCVSLADVYSLCIGGSRTTFSNKEALRIATVLRRLGFSRIPGSKRIAARYEIPFDKLL